MHLSEEVGRSCLGEFLVHSSPIKFFFLKSQRVLFTELVYIWSTCFLGIFCNYNHACIMLIQLVILVFVYG